MAEVWGCNICHEAKLTEEGICADCRANLTHPTHLLMYLYRTPEQDDDGDPLDWGAVFATNRTEAAALILARFEEIGLFGWDGGEIEIKLYGPHTIPTTPGIPTDRFGVDGATGTLVVAGTPGEEYEITTVTLTGDPEESINPDTGQPWQEDDAHGAQCAMRVIASAECTCGKADAMADREED